MKIFSSHLAQFLVEESKTWLRTAPFCFFLVFCFTPALACRPSEQITIYIWQELWTLWLISATIQILAITNHICCKGRGKKHFQGQFWNNQEFTLKPTNCTLMAGPWAFVDSGKTELMWTSAMRQSFYSVAICNYNKCWKKKKVANVILQIWPSRVPVSGSFVMWMYKNHCFLHVEITFRLVVKTGHQLAEMCCKGHSCICSWSHSQLWFSTRCSILIEYEYLVLRHCCGLDVF